MQPRVAFIVPTTAAAERRDYLPRSVESVLAQAGVDASVIVVANGERCDDVLLATLEGMKRVTIVRVAEGSLPLALKIGRRHVATPFFGELDDDDILLPRALECLFEGFLREPEAHVVVGNGIIRCAGSGDVEVNTELDVLRTHPLCALLQKLWLYPGGALFRSDAVSETDFSNIPKYYEWTYLAAHLCLNHRLSFVPSQVFIHHEGLPFSTDRSREALFGRVGALQAILSLPLPGDIRRGFRGKLGAQYHDCSDAYLHDRKILRALACHLSSLTLPEGWRYLSYSRHILRAALKLWGPLR